MSDGDTLLRAIRENPESDDPRLLYADWLEENGQAARGQFIRTTIRYLRFNQMFETGNVTRADVPLYQEAIAAWKACGWKPELPAGIEWNRSDLKQRGFVEVIRCSAADWIEYGDSLISGNPMREVTLTTFPNPLGWDGVWPAVTFHIAGQTVHLQSEPLDEMDVLSARWPKIVFALPPHIIPLLPSERSQSPMT